MRRFPFALALVGILLVSAPVRAQSGHTCVFVLSMTEGSDVNNLDFTVNYAGLDGDIEGSGRKAVCSSALSGGFAAVNDDDAANRLSVAVARLSKFSAPARLLGCEVFYDTDVPVAGDFVVTVSNAGRDGGDDNVKPTPKVKVVSIECPGELPSPTSTTTSTTTTTSIPVTTSTVPIEDLRCGFPATDGDRPTAADALATLRAAVGLRDCELCVCDIDASGKINAADALGVLRTAVGIEDALDCLACPT